MEKCKICGKEFNSRGSITTHIRYNHLDYNSKKYYDEFLKKSDNEGKCLECGKETRYYGIVAGYASFCCKQCANRSNDKNIKARQTFIRNHPEIYCKREKQNKPKRIRKKRSRVKRVKTKNRKVEKEIERYGKSGLSAKEKIEATCLKRYGVKCYTQSKEFKQKVKQTSIEKYGVEHPMQSEEVRENLKRSVLKKYGVENSSQNEEIVRRTNETKQRKNLEFQQLGYTQVKDLVKIYGHGWRLKKIVPIIRHLNHGYVKNEDIPKIIAYSSESHYGQKCCVSILEKEVGTYIKEICPYTVIENTRKVIYPLELDIYIPELKIAFEFDGSYWHSNKIKDESYHLNKTNMCKEKGVRLFHIFESEWKDEKENTERFIESKILGIRSFNEETIKIDLTKDSILEYPEYRVLQITGPQLIQQYDYSVWNCGYAVLTKSPE